MIKVIALSWWMVADRSLYDMDSRYYRNQQSNVEGRYV